MMTRKVLIRSLGLLAAAVLAGCGGGEDAGNQNPKVAYSHLVSFGDSLSDVGSYKVSGVAAAGGGKFTVNGGDDRIWVERLSATLGLGAPCAAQTGLNAIQAVVGFPPVPATNISGCYAYAQGGARVTNPVGPGNALLFNQADPTSYSNAIGALTRPLVSQVAGHLAANGGAFGGDELVAVMAGGNDTIVNTAIFGATVAAGGDPATAAAAATTAVTAAATELVALIKNEILAKGAQRVVVVNLPDLSQTPAYAGQDASVVAVVAGLVQAFNNTVASGVGSDERVLIIDAYTIDRDQNANPARYALTDVTHPACGETSSLLCSLVTVAANNVSGQFKYADGVHPTPFTHQLLAQLVAVGLAQRGWL